MANKIEKILHRLQSEPIHRSMTVVREGIDTTARTARLAFASDAPVDHWLGPLILTTKKKNVRSERMSNGLALLDNHNRREQIGIVEDFSFDSDGIIRGTARFSRGEEADEIFQDVVDGIKRFVSVGFMIYELHVDNEKDGIVTYRCDDWEPFEVSIVSVPADYGVGVGRSLDAPAARDGEEDICPECDLPMDECECEENAARSLPISNPTSLTREFSNNGENNMTEAERLAAEAEAQRTAAASAVADTRSAAQIAVAGLRGWESAMPNDAPAIDAYIRANLGDNGTFTGTEAGMFAAIRAAQPPAIKIPVEDPAAIAARSGGGDHPGTHLATIGYRGGALKAFKGEDRLERAHRAGMFFLATLGRNAKALAFCQEKGLIRAHSGEFNSTGGVLVPDEMDQNIIDLRIQYGVFRRNANVAPMSSDTLIRPRRTGGLTPYFTGGGDAATESTKGWDSITLVAKKLSVLTKYETELSEDAVINIADDLTSEIAYAFAKKEDECGFNGDGSATYGGMIGVRPGLLNQSATRANIASLKVAATGHNLWSELDLADHQGLIGLLPQFARQSGNVKFYCSHEYYATVLMRIAQAVGGVTATEIQNGFGPSFFGVPVEIVEVMPHVEGNDQVCLLYGNLSQAATLGDRRGVTIAMSNSDGTDFAKGIMAIRGDTRFDINFHEKGNVTATAADKLPGPIVGLLTAAS